MTDEEIAYGRKALTAVFSSILRAWKTGRATATLGGHHTGWECEPTGEIFFREPVRDRRSVVFDHRPHDIPIELAVSYSPDGVYLKDVPELTTREQLAFSVLDSDDRAATAALADHMVEEGVEYAEAAYERGLAAGEARERERVAGAAREFFWRFRDRAVEGYGGYPEVNRNPTLRASVRMVEAHLEELAAFLTSGKTLDEWEMERRADELIHLMNNGFMSRSIFLEAQGIFSVDELAPGTRPEATP